MPNYRYTCHEDRTYTHIPTVLDDAGEAVEFAADDLVEGDVIEAAVNPDESRFEETTDPVGKVERPGAEPEPADEPVTETAAQKRKRLAAEKKAAAAVAAQADAETAAEQQAFDALSDEDKAAVAALTPDELAALRVA